jgi:PAS domain S-box-containing protein
MAQLGVLLGGTVTTLVICLALALFLDGVLRAEKVVARDAALSRVTQSLEIAEGALRTAATLLRSGQEMEGLPPPKSFDHLLLAREDRPGIWTFEDIYVYPAPESERGVRWTPPTDFGRWARHVQLTETSHVHVFSEFPGLEAPLQRGGADLPFVMVHALGTEETNSILLIGLTRFSTLLGERAPGGIAVSLVMQDGQQDPRTPLYAHGGVQSKGEGAAFHLSAAGRVWEVRVEPDLGSGAHFLTYLPLYAGGAGAFITLLLLFFVRLQGQAARRLAQANRSLENKNTQMERALVAREQATEALRKAEEENRSIINSVSDVIFEIDRQGHLLFLNAAWRVVTGTEPDDALQTELFAFLPERDQRRAHAALFALMSGDTEDTPDTQRLMTGLRTAGGTFRSVEMTLRRIEQGRAAPPRIVGTMTDVEERAQAQAALIEAEKKFRAIVENAAGGIYQMTREGLYISANPALARILGYDSPQDLMRNVKNAHRAVYADPASRAAFIKTLEERGQAHAPEVEVVRKDGTHIWVSENARAVRDQENDRRAILYYEGSLEDVTARRAAERALREAKLASEAANRSKTEFLANMSHELRTPLNAIIGFGEIIRGEALGPIGSPEYKEYAAEIHESGRRLMTVINEILDISRIEAGERHLSEAALDLAIVAKSVCVAVALRAEEAGVRLVNAVSGPLPFIGEERALKQMLLNLLSNAIKFTPAGGQVRLEARRIEGGGLTLSVTDTGIGMDPEEAQKALTPFGQVESALNREGSGTGLGLTLVQALARLHGAEIAIVSQKGIGTTVTLTFPPERVGSEG